jgi:hypothetical protein
METEAVEDVKKARPCDCGHTLALHEADGAGRCTACACPGPPPLEEPDPLEEAVAADEARRR